MNKLDGPNTVSLQLDERLKREGTKTHKERVEELNRYLSNLSEHHDMYVSTALDFLLGSGHWLPLHFRDL